MKRDLIRLPALQPESLRTARPSGPVRFSPHDAPSDVCAQARYGPVVGSRREH